MFPRAGAHQLGQEAFKTILAEDVTSVRRLAVGHLDNRDGAAWTGIPQRDGRPATQQLLGGVGS